MEKNNRFTLKVKDVEMEFSEKLAWALVAAANIAALGYLIKSMEWIFK